MRSMSIVMRKHSAFAATAIFVVACVGGCATAPPVRIQEAIGAVHRYLPEYVTEANKALRDAHHPDQERLTGIGDRLVSAVDALSRWAGEGQGGPR